MRTFQQLQRAAVQGASLLCVTVLAGCASGSAGSSTVGGTPTTAGEVRISQPNASRGTTSGADENIRVEMSANSRTATGTPVVPPGKQAAGTATRGTEVCTIHFDNRSRLYIGTFADGIQRATLDPYGDVYTYVVAGPTRLYARAGFDDGSTATWGPVMVDCPPGGSYTWRLTYTE